MKDPLLEAVRAASRNARTDEEMTTLFLIEATRENLSVLETARAAYLAAWKGRAYEYYVKYRRTLWRIDENGYVTSESMFDDLDREVLKEAREALYIAHENTGSDPESAYADALSLVNRALA
jgi:hypothetical protein